MWGHKLSDEDQDNALTIEFENGGDYSSYFAPPDLILANGAVAVGTVLEEVLVAFPQVGSLLSGNEEINADNVASDQVQNASDSSKNEKHGDSGAVTKAEKQIKDLEAQLGGANRKQKNKINQKIKNIRKNAQSQRGGEEHSRTHKR